MKLKQKIKLSIIIAVEFISIVVILLLVFLAGKKTYTVTFDLNGGTLMSGDLVQEVSQGKNATPPTAVKEGCYLHSWSASYKQITKDIVIEAVWEWTTSVGLDYTSSDDSNYCEIVGCFKDLTGDVYVGVYHNSKKVLGIRDASFKGCDSIENIYMLDGILSIGDSAFEDCTSLVSVQLPESLAKLGSNAFKNCKSLVSITLPEGLKVIPSGAFEGCESLTTVIIPSTVTVIEDGAFKGCTSLAYIAAAEAEEDVFDDGDDKNTEGNAQNDREQLPEDEEPAPSVTLLLSLVSIGADAFRDCTSLESVALPEGLTGIGEGAFYGCDELVSVVLPTTLTEIGSNAFRDCGKLTSAVIPEGVTLIAYGTFAGCVSLSEVVIPSTVEKIEKNAFGGCTELADMEIPETVLTVEEGIFEYPEAAFIKLGYQISADKLDKIARENAIEPSARYEIFDMLELQIEAETEDVDLLLGEISE